MHMVFVPSLRYDIRNLLLFFVCLVVLIFFKIKLLSHSSWEGIMQSPSSSGVDLVNVLLKVMVTHHLIF